MLKRLFIAGAIAGFGVGVYLGGGQDSALFRACAACAGLALAIELSYAIGRAHW